MATRTGKISREEAQAKFAAAREKKAVAEAPAQTAQPTAPPAQEEGFRTVSSQGDFIPLESQTVQGALQEAPGAGAAPTAGVQLQGADTGQPIPAGVLDGSQQPFGVAPGGGPLSTDSLIAEQEAKRVSSLTKLGAQRADTSATEQAIRELRGEIGQESPFRAEQERQQGLEDIESQLFAITAEQGAQRKRAIARQLQAEKDVIGTGVTTSFLSKRLSNRERDDSIRSLILGAEADTLQGSRDAANARVDRAVTAKFDPIRAELETQEFNLDRLDMAVKEGTITLTSAEKTKLSLQRDKVKENRADSKEAERLIAQRLKNSPTPAVRDQLLQAQTVEDVNAIAGEEGLTFDEFVIQEQAKEVEKQKAEQAAQGIPESEMTFTGGSQRLKDLRSEFDALNADQPAGSDFIPSVKLTPSKKAEVAAVGLEDPRAQQFFLNGDPTTKRIINQGVQSGIFPPNMSVEMLQQISDEIENQTGAGDTGTTRENILGDI